MANIQTAVKLKVGKDQNIPAEIVTFSDLDCDKEHIALIVAPSRLSKTPLVRIHSECLTGDVFFSSRCDCGKQLEQAIELMSQQGGVVLYLRQEGRGIGLYNKIKAYELQDQGVDTFTANVQLGLPEDSRNFDIAAQMLQALEIEEVYLLSNNPKKREVLEYNGIQVCDVVNTNVFSTHDNLKYLIEKKNLKGHSLQL